ncbi:hypothetical protein ABK040_001285 [Willaertia magna]
MLTTSVEEEIQQQNSNTTSIKEEVANNHNENQNDTTENNNDSNNNNNNNNIEKHHSSKRSSESENSRHLTLFSQAMDPFWIEEIDQTEWLVLFHSKALNTGITKRSSVGRVGSIHTTLPLTIVKDEGKVFTKKFFGILSTASNYIQKGEGDVVFMSHPHLRHCLQVFFKPFKILHYEAVPYRSIPFKSVFEEGQDLAADSQLSETNQLKSPTTPTETFDKNNKKNKDGKDKNKSNKNKKDDTAVEEEDDFLPSLAKILDIEKSQAEKVTDGKDENQDLETLFDLNVKMGDFPETGMKDKLTQTLKGFRRSTTFSPNVSSSSGTLAPNNNKKSRKSIIGNIVFKSGHDSVNISEHYNSSSNSKPTEENKNNNNNASQEIKQTDSQPTIQVEGSTDSNSILIPSSLFAKNEEMDTKNTKGLIRKPLEKKVIDVYDEIDVSKSLKKSLVEKAKELSSKRAMNHFTDMIGALKTAEIKAPITPEVIEKTKRLMSCLQPKYKYKPLHTTLCQRLGSLEYPVRKKFKFLLSCGDFKFETGDIQNKEIFTFSLSLYDVKYSRKLTEDFHFHFLTESQLASLPSTLADSLRKSMPREGKTEKRLFNVSHPHDDVYLVLFVYRIPTCSVKDALKYYENISAKKKVSEWELNYKEKKSGLAPFRQPIFFTYSPVFEMAGCSSYILKSSTITFDSLNVIEGDYKSLFSIAQAVKQKNKGRTVDAGLKIYLEQLNEKYNVVSLEESKEAAESFDSDICGSVDEQALSLQPTNNFLMDENGENNSGSLDANSLQNPLNNIQEINEDEDDLIDNNSESNDNNSYRQTISVENVRKNVFQMTEQMKALESSCIREIPWSKSRYPNSKLFNTLYLYLIGAKLEKAHGKNIFIEVMFRESDDKLPTDEELKSLQPLIIDRFTSEKKKFDLSTLQYDEKFPQFLDEIKLELPPVARKGNHLLFVFYHVDIDGKKSSKLNYSPTNHRQEELGKSEKAVIGYSFLDLTENNKAYEKGITTSAFRLEHPEVQKHFFFGEVRVYKQLTNNYLEKSKIKGSLEKVKDARLKLMTQLVSSVSPQDEVLQLFFASIHDLYSPEKEGQKDLILEFICRNVLMKFCDIDFTLFMPHLPIVMNILFELMCNVSELAIREDLKKGAERLLFEQILVCLRGVYHHTKNQTRSNKFMSSYITYVLDEMNKNHTIYSVLLTILTDYLEELEKVLKGDPTKHYFETNNLSEHDPIRFSWFIFDVIIKSLTLCIKTDYVDTISTKESWEKSTEGQDSKDSKLSQDYFVTKVKQLTYFFCSRTKKLLASSGHGRNNIGLNGNRNLALFIRDLIPFIDRKHLIEIIKHYMECLSGDELQEVKLRLKCEFISVICDYDYFIPLNNQHLAEGNFIIRHFFDVFFSIAESSNEKLMLKIGKCLLDLFCKIDYDSRYQEVHRKAAIAEMFLYYVNRYLSKEEYLTMFHHDELYVLTTVCLLWVLRNLSDQQFIQWWLESPLHVQLNCLTFMEYAVVSFNNLDFSSTIPKAVSGKKDTQKPLCLELMMSIQHLLSVITSRDLLSEVLEKSKVENDIEKLMANKEDVQVAQIISKLEITRNIKGITPVESVILRYISRLLFNMIYQLNRKKHYDIVSLLFTDCLHPLLTNFGNYFICQELYDLTIPKKERLPIAQKRKFESKWRLLLGASMAFSEELVQSGDSGMSELIEVAKDCVKLLLQPFEYVMTRDLPEVLEVEEEDVIVDPKRNLIASATFDCLVTKIFSKAKYVASEENKPFDTENNQAFEATFINTFSTFTTPCKLMHKLMTLYSDPNVDQLSVERLMTDLITKAFYTFDNEAIAQYVFHFKTIVKSIKQKQLQKSNGQTKLPVHPTLQKIRKALVQHLFNAKKDYTIEEQSDKKHLKQATVMIPKGLSIDKLKEPEIPMNKWKIQKTVYLLKNIPNPYNIPFDLLQWQASEVARQITIIDMKIFKKIENNEFYNSAWSDPKYKYELAPNISALTDRVNNMSYWVQTCILTETNLEIRRAMYKKFIEIASEAKALNNYSALFAIVSGLQSGPVHRLKETQKILPVSENELFKEFDELQANNRFKLRENFRSCISMNETPIIPFIGLFQTDLTFTMDGNPDEFEHPKNPKKKLINYQKRRIYYSTIETVNSAQNSATWYQYQLEPIPYLQYVLKEQIFENIITDEDELYKRSLTIEPRKPQSQ